MFAAVLLLLAVLVYRIALPFFGGGPAVLGMNNFSPMSALVLCGAAFLPRRWAITLPLAALFISDLILNAHYHAPLFDAAELAQYVAFAIVAAIGWRIRGKAPGWRLFGASLVGTLVFYVITNTASWAFRPEYTGGFAAWLAALTTGVPGYPPTWLFLRNSAVSDLVFTALFVLCLSYRGPSSVPAREAIPAIP